MSDILNIDAALQASTGPGDFGLTPTGFVPKPFARLIAEKLALARELFGNSVDLTSGSAIRKCLEISALEDARQWSMLGPHSIAVLSHPHSAKPFQESDANWGFRGRTWKLAEL